MKRLIAVYSTHYILSFCSMVYVLILAQSLSAFAGDTLLQYSLTFGLYMFSAGVGAIFAAQKFTNRFLSHFIKVEIAMTVMGGFSVIFLYGLDWLNLPRGVLSVFAYLLILGVGTLTGFERVCTRALGSFAQNTYEMIVTIGRGLGLFSGAFMFAVIFLPRLGLVTTSFLVACLGITLTSLLAVTRYGVVAEELDEVKEYTYVVWVLLGLMLVCLIASPMITEWLT